LWRCPIDLQIARYTRLIQKTLQLAVHGRRLTGLPEAVGIVTQEVCRGVKTLMESGRDEMLLEYVVWLSELETDALLEIDY